MTGMGGERTGSFRERQAVMCNMAEQFIDGVRAEVLLVTVKAMAFI
jgi:hypothetical protein